MSKLPPCSTAEAPVKWSCPRSSRLGQTDVLSGPQGIESDGPGVAPKDEADRLYRSSPCLTCPADTASRFASHPTYCSEICECPKEDVIEALLVMRAGLASFLHSLCASPTKVSQIHRIVGLVLARWADNKADYRFSVRYRGEFYARFVRGDLKSKSSSSSFVSDAVVAEGFNEGGNTPPIPKDNFFGAIQQVSRATRSLSQRQLERLKLELTEKQLEALSRGQVNLTLNSLVKLANAAGKKLVIRLDAHNA